MMFPQWEQISCVLFVSFCQNLKPQFIELDDGKIGTGKPIKFDGKNHGFRLRFSRENQSNDQSGECMARILYRKSPSLKERPVSATSKAFGMLGEKTMVSGCRKKMGVNIKIAGIYGCSSH